MNAGPFGTGDGNSLSMTTRANSAPMFNPDEIRAAFNLQHRDHGGPDWVRLNLSTGPVLARRNVSHQSSPIYVAVVNQDVVRHYMVTTTRQLKSNGTTKPSPGLLDAWVALIGYTAEEYKAAKTRTPKTHFTEQRIALYEGGAR